MRPSGTAIFSRGGVPDQQRLATGPGQNESPQANEGLSDDGDNGLHPGSLHAWIGGVLKQVLKSRTPLGFFISKCISGCKGSRLASSTALFPIPLPCDNAWSSRLQRPGKSHRDRLAVRKVLSLAICALNYVYLPSPIASLKNLQRCPSPAHVGVYKRLTALIKAGGPSGLFSSLGCGRKSQQLDARLSELLRAVQSLGLGESSFYMKDKVYSDVPQVNDRDELVPYRSLAPDRLKLSGRGQWDCRGFLGDLLYMPFVEPRVNQFDIIPPKEVCPDFSTIEKKDIVGLCKVWDARSLLKIYPKSFGPGSKIGCSKVFNCFKNESCDRQIGDRRSQNFREGKLPGPSKHLPSGPALLQLAPRRFDQQVIGCIADRRDFYHQFWIPEERATTNCLFPFLRASELDGLAALEVFRAEFGQKKKPLGRRARELEGDFLHGPRPSLLVEADPEVVACFGSLFQGDHLGVEIATDAHQNLLTSVGLLQDASRIWGKAAVWSDEVVQGLCIDDFFSLSLEPLQDGVHSHAGSVDVFLRAKETYLRYGLEGSDDKDVVAQDRFRVIGAEIISDPATVRDGVVSVASPFEKRLGLGFCSACLASLPFTSDAVHSSLVGSWISVLSYRRCCMALLNEVFGVIPAAELNPENPVLWKLPRKAAEEFQLMALLAPVLSSNVAVPFLEEVFATDSSNSMGGITSADVGEEVSKVLWRTAEKKSPNVPMLPKTSVLSYMYDLSYEEEAHGPEYVADDEDFGLSSQGFAVHRPLGLRFQFLEICGGAGKVSIALSKKGVVCGPVFDLSFSRQYNVADSRVVQWVIFMLEQDRLDSFLVAPPCTSFSAAAFPSHRTYRAPRGDDLSIFSVWIGNKLAFAAITLLMVALRLKKFGLGEQPRRSKMRWLDEWQRLLYLGAREAFLASCRFGSPHQKEFVFVGANMQVELLNYRCTRDHFHIPIQGKFTKPSATYTDALAEALAVFFKDHLDALRRAADRLNVKVDGLEDIATNDISSSFSWRVLSAWSWKGSSHINILEVAAAFSLLKMIAAHEGDCRFVVFLDSNVAKCALTRGRSSSCALRSLLKRVAGICLAFGLYPAFRFVPTRLNTADAPSRQKDLDIPAACSIVRGLYSSSLTSLCSLAPLKRWVSNWVRLSLLLCPGILLYVRHPSEFRSHPLVPIDVHEWAIDFDSTLGYPGEGPRPTSFLPLLIAALVQASLVFAVGRASVDLRSHGDAARREARKGIELAEGRRTTEQTAFTRDWLYQRFLLWLSENGLNEQTVVFATPPDIDMLNKVLCEYGKWLFKQGRPYYHYSETINSVSTKRPSVRRTLQQAWDLAFMWGSYEPATHHVAMPFQILTAVLALCLTWGWSREAAVFALAWGAVLRIGEVQNARRSDLIMPGDVWGSIDHVLIKIAEPKTRFKAARHQSSKVEQPDLVLIVQLGFGALAKDEWLWPFSGSTLRSRLAKILARLDLPCKPGQFPKPLTLGSFRPGGATWLITQCESAELVKRRGRWVSSRVMECYLQEVSAATYMNDISAASRACIEQALAAFPSLLAAVIHFRASKIPEVSWFFLLSRRIV